MARIREKVSDSRVLRLVEMFLEQGVMDGLREWTPETGTPQGAVLSPLLANIYLNPLDHLLADAGFALVRYADDFVILCARLARTRTGPWPWCNSWVAENELTLHPTKTKIVDARTEGFDFLGYHFRGELRLPREKSLKKFKDAVRAKTKRTNGQCLPFRLCPAEFATARLVHVLSPLSLARLPRPGRLDSRSPAQHPAQAPQTARPRPRARTTNVGRMPSSTNRGCTA